MSRGSRAMRGICSPYLFPRRACCEKFGPMATFITGATGYLGSYVVAGLLKRHPSEKLTLLVRAKSRQDAERRMWKALQLHMEFDEFLAGIRDRCTLLTGDITEPALGLDGSAYDGLVRSADSVIHIAASLNRKSSKSCYNINLRGTLAVIRMAMQAHAHHGLRRFSDVSTMAVAGIRNHELIPEHEMIDWTRSDYDTYSRTKKFAEHMVRELLRDTSTIVFRPSIVFGDSRFPDTTQFDMAMAFAWLCSLPILPFDSRWHIDIVPADFVGDAIVEIHQRPAPKYDAYNLSAGDASPTYHEIMMGLLDRGFGRPRRFIPALGEPCEMLAGLLMHTPRSWKVAYPASLMKVFFPYLLADTRYENRRVIEELGVIPRPFPSYAYEFLRYTEDHRFRYPYRPWPEGAGGG